MSWDFGWIFICNRVLFPLFHWTEFSDISGGFSQWLSKDNKYCFVGRSPPCALLGDCYVAAKSQHPVCKCWDGQSWVSSLVFGMAYHGFAGSHRGCWPGWQMGMLFVSCSYGDFMHLSVTCCHGFCFHSKSFRVPWAYGTVYTCFCEAHIWMLEFSGLRELCMPAFMKLTSGKLNSVLLAAEQRPTSQLVVVHCWRWEQVSRHLSKNHTACISHNASFQSGASRNTTGLYLSTRLFPASHWCGAVWA